MARNPEKELLQFQVSPTFKRAVELAAKRADGGEISVAVFCRQAIAAAIGYNGPAAKIKTKKLRIKRRARARAK